MMKFLSPCLPSRMIISATPYGAVLATGMGEYPSTHHHSVDWILPSGRGWMSTRERAGWVIPAHVTDESGGNRQIVSLRRRQRVSRPDSAAGTIEVLGHARAPLGHVRNVFFSLAYKPMHARPSGEQCGTEASTPARSSPGCRVSLAELYMDLPL